MLYRLRQSTVPVIHGNARSRKNLELGYFDFWLFSGRIKAAHRKEAYFTLEIISFKTLISFLGEEEILF